MQITQSQIDHFHRNGFIFIPNPLDEAKYRQIERLQHENEPVWERTDWPETFNKMACQFLNLGEPALQLMEHPDLIHMAQRLLDHDEVHIGACGCGDAAKIVSADGRPQRQVHWHGDGSPGVKQVSFRTALDRHDPTNAPLRILPGSHLRPHAEVEEEFLQLEIATGQHNKVPDHLFVKHPHEVEVVLDPRWTLVWNPSCWHATGVKTAAGPRRTVAWNYFPSGGRTRDTEALKYIFSDTWQQWPESRQKLWKLESGNS